MNIDKNEPTQLAATFLFEFQDCSRFIIFMSRMQYVKTKKCFCSVSLSLCSCMVYYVNT